MTEKIKKLNGYILGDAKSTATAKNDNVHVVRIVCPYRGENNMTEYRTYSLIIPQNIFLRHQDVIKNNKRIIVYGNVIPMAMNIKGENIVRYFLKVSKIEIPIVKSNANTKSKHIHTIPPKRNRYNSDWFSR